MAATSTVIEPEKWGKIGKTAAAGDWENEAWEMVDLVGELAFGIMWKAALLSRFRLIASDLDPDTGLPTGSTENVRAKEIVRGIAGGVAGQSQMLGHASPLLSVPGQFYIAVIYPQNKATGVTTEEWHVLSRDEIKTQGTTVTLTLPDDSKYEMNPETDTISRIHRPHPRKSSMATSPIKSALPILREIVRMTQNIEGAGKSRQAGNGILFLPEEVSMSTQQAPTGAVDPDAPTLPPPPPVVKFVNSEEIRVALQEAMSIAIKDPSSAAALVPIILQMKGEWIDKVRHLTFGSEVSEKSQIIRENGVRRLAMTLDMPPEVLLGQADLNHWSLTGVEEQAVRWHTAPDMEIICDGLTQNLLRPMMGEEPGSETVVVWYTTEDVEAEPDEALVSSAFDRGLVNSAAVLRKLRLSPEDDGYPMTEQGWRDWAADRVRSKPELLPVLGPLLSLPTVVEPAPAIDEAPADPPPVEQPQDPGLPQNSEAASAIAVKLCVNRALELAGKRRRTRDNSQQLRTVPICKTHEALGRVHPLEAKKLIAGWDELITDAEMDSFGVNPSRLRAMVEAKAMSLLAAGAE